MSDEKYISPEHTIRNIMLNEGNARPSISPSNETIRRSGQPTTSRSQIPSSARDAARTPLMPYSDVPDIVKGAAKEVSPNILSRIGSIIRPVLRLPVKNPWAMAAQIVFTPTPAGEGSAWWGPGGRYKTEKEFNDAVNRGEVLGFSRTPVEMPIPTEVTPEQPPEAPKIIPPVIEPVNPPTQPSVPVPERIPEPATPTKTPAEAPAPTQTPGQAPGQAPATTPKTEITPISQSESQSRSQQRKKESEEPQNRKGRLRFPFALPGGSLAPVPSATGINAPEEPYYLHMAKERLGEELRTEIENVARPNSSRDKVMARQQSIKKKIIDENKRNVDIIREIIKQKKNKKIPPNVELNPELKQREPE